MANLSSGSLNSRSKIVNELPNSANALSSVAHSSLPTLSIKLGERNYSHWRSQVLPALTSYALDGFFTVSWLNSSITESMFRHVAKCGNAYEIWNTLELHFQSFSKVRTLHLRNLLQSTKKESMSVNEYILKMKELRDELVASGVQIGDEELLLYILDGLGPEFDAMVANLVANSSTATLQEAQILLHKHEMRTEKQNSILSNFHGMSSALLATKQASSDVGGVSQFQIPFVPQFQNTRAGGVIPHNIGSPSTIQPTTS
ncbi:uncharacterized protein LOC116128426 [Pistacia vera]|uniref:uncharacterized protein LOC116128426 n=1 Tax=Pistacia vera TaxID=55513 RepID=UPI001262BB4E|nr:uncharacterized protein LOC116128426 [Pistacia vera]